MGKSTISMGIFNSYVKLPEGTFCREHVENAWRLNIDLSIWPEKMAIEQLQSWTLLWNMIKLYVLNKKPGSVPAKLVVFSVPMVQNQERQSLYWIFCSTYFNIQVWHTTEAPNWNSFLQQNDLTKATWIITSWVSSTIYAVQPCGCGVSEVPNDEGVPLFHIVSTVFRDVQQDPDVENTNHFYPFLDDFPGASPWFSTSMWIYPRIPFQLFGNPVRGDGLNSATVLLHGFLSMPCSGISQPCFDTGMSRYVSKYPSKHPMIHHYWPSLSHY